MKRFLALMLTICTILTVFSACTDIPLDTDIQPPSSTEISDIVIDAPDESDPTDDVISDTQPTDTQQNENKTETEINSTGSAISAMDDD